MLSNLLVYDISKQYKEDPTRFQQQQKKTIYDVDSDAEEEADLVEEEPEADSNKKDAKEGGAQTPNDLPFF